HGADTARQDAGAEPAVVRGIQPRGHENAWVDGRSPRVAAAGADAVIQGAEVESRGETPGGASGVIGLEEVVDRPRRKELLAVGGAQPGCGRAIRLRAGSRCGFCGCGVNSRGRRRWATPGARRGGTLGALRWVAWPGHRS